MALTPEHTDREEELMAEEADFTIKLEPTFGAGRQAELRLVRGPQPYFWMGDEEGCWAVLDIPPELKRRATDLIRDLGAVKVR